jgi:epoxyqueuosine reductase
VELRARIRALALESGLAGFGICDAAPFEDTGRDLEEAVASGRSGKLKFTFADPATSADPTRSFPWARRLLVGAHRYAADAGSPGPPTPGTGRVARFAEDDHYAPLRAVLGGIAAMLRAEGHRAEVLVDDNRLVDRAAAVRAGVGWWGKSSMVLVPGAGPWVLLGSVVTDASLDVDSPMRRDCGTCDACIPACPTGAIVAPGILDARRCLAHWAQAPGSIPTELREPMGDRVYGCDDCLEACPPGHRAIAGGAEGRGRVDLVSLLGSDDQTLRTRYERFYVPRNDVKYLRRNALVALGNSGGEDAVGVLAGFAAHRDPMLREHAAWALGRIGGARAAAALRAAADAGLRAAVDAGSIQESPAGASAISSGA